MCGTHEKKKYGFVQNANQHIGIGQDISNRKNLKAPPNLVGLKFNRLTVVSRAVVQNPKNSYWNCKCDCGKFKTVRRQHLISGNVRSCGCYAKEVSSKVHTIHGLNGTRAYVVWHGMISRCYKKSADSYYLYGGRGISVCKRWRESVVNFFKDMGEPKTGMSIERIDNNGDYSPENCKWATLREQMNNKRNNVVLKHKGVSLSMAEWSRKTGIPYSAISGRIRLGWKVKDALTLPVMERVKYKSRVVTNGNN